jgi:GntR family transcriptional repressor for pyruvate dehydrogenase complex
MAYLKAAKKSRVVDDVFNQLLSSISDKTWREGDKIPSENELAQTFQVSRFSVRTAIQRLIALGILESYQGGGTYVAQQNGRQVVNPLITELTVNPKSIAELLELRRTIEVAICEYAAQRADKSDLEKMERILGDMSSAAEREQIRQFCKADVEFHLALASASKNSIFLYIYEMIRDTIYNHFINQTKLHGIYVNLQYHYDIFNAIRNRNAEGAVKSMRENLNKVSTLMAPDKRPNKNSR